MTHDKRDEAGMYRPLSSAEMRHKRAREETQTRDGLFTHVREASERRNPIAVDQFNAKLFVDKRANRRPYMPKGM